MALEHLLQAIEQQVAGEIASARAEGQEQVAAIQAEAELQAARAADAAWVGENERLLAARRRIQAGAQLEALRARRELLERLYREAVDALRETLAGVRQREDWPERFAALVREARARLPEASLARVDPRDRALLEGLELGLAADDELESWGGVVLVAGRRTLDNTLERRVAQAEPLLRQQLAHELAER